MDSSGLLSLKWNNHTSTFFNVLSTIKSKSSYSDAALACEGRLFPAHKLVLAACSDYFQQIFAHTDCRRPVIVLKDIKTHEIEALLNYMYLGEVNVLQSQLAGLIKAAECLKIKGLAVPDDQTENVQHNHVENPENYSGNIRNQGDNSEKHSHNIHTQIGSGEKHAHSIHSHVEKSENNNDGAGNTRVRRGSGGDSNSGDVSNRSNNSHSGSVNGSGKRGAGSEHGDKGSPQCKRMKRNEERRSVQDEERRSRNRQQSNSSGRSPSSERRRQRSEDEGSQHEVFLDVVKSEVGSPKHEDVVEEGEEFFPLEDGADVGGMEGDEVGNMDHKDRSLTHVDHTTAEELLQSALVGAGEAQYQQQHYAGEDGGGGHSVAVVFHSPEQLFQPHQNSQHLPQLRQKLALLETQDEESEEKVATDRLGDEANVLTWLEQNVAPEQVPRTLESSQVSETGAAVAAAGVGEVTVEAHQSDIHFSNDALPPTRHVQETHATFSLLNLFDAPSDDLYNKAVPKNWENSFVCSICNKGFVQKCLLTRHMKIHTPGEKCKCHFCPFETTFRFNLKSHMARRHDHICNYNEKCPFENHSFK